MPPLTEAAQIRDKEILAEQRYSSRMDKRGFWVFFVDKLIEKGSLDGKVVYLVDTYREEANIEEGRIEVQSDVALYDSHFKLIAAHAWGTIKGRRVLFGYRWKDGKLIQHRGKSKVGLEIPSPSRPTDILGTIMQRSLRPDAKRTLTILDLKQGKASEVQIERIGQEWTFDGSTKDEKIVTWKFLLDVDGGTEVFINKENGELQQGTQGKDKNRLTSTDKDIEECSYKISRNWLMAQTSMRQIYNSWSKKGKSRSNRTIGLKMRVPKGWKAANTLSEATTQIYVVEPKNLMVSMQLNALLAPVNVDLRTYARRLLKQQENMVPRGEYKIEGVRFNSKSAQKASFKMGNSREFQEVLVHFILHKKWVILVYQIKQPSLDKKAQKTLSGLIKSLRFTDR